MIRYTTHNALCCAILVAGLSMSAVSGCELGKCLSYDECSKWHDGSRVDCQRCISPPGTVCCPVTNLPFDICGERFPPRIIGGQPTSPGVVPWAALLGYRPKNSSSAVPAFFCGGTLISARYVLTAAHCVVSKLTGPPVLVRLGECDLRQDPDTYYSNGHLITADNYEEREVESSIPHVNYNNVTFKNDIALLRLKQPLQKFTDYIRPICLPFGLDPIDETDIPYDVAGWGTTNHSNLILSKVLRIGNLSGIPIVDCNAAIGYENVKPLVETQICAGAYGVEAAKGDSGGPLFKEHLHNEEVRVYQFGIVSFRKKFNPATDGGEPPGVYTNVTAYRTWILKNLKP